MEPSTHAPEMTGAEFAEWRKRCGLSLTAAAAALALNRATIARYQVKGAPRLIRLACLGYECEQNKPLRDYAHMRKALGLPE